MLRQFTPLIITNFTFIFFPLVSKSTSLTGALVPHEYRYLNKSILNKAMSSSSSDGSSHSDKGLTHGHFNLLKNPRATSQLRADILQRG